MTPKKLTVLENADQGYDLITDWEHNRDLVQHIQTGDVDRSLDWWHRLRDEATFIVDVLTERQNYIRERIQAEAELEAMREEIEAKQRGWDDEQTP